MKGSDLIALTLKNSGIQNIHTVTGGAIVHVIDSCANLGLNVFYYNHEQAASLAAVAESKITSRPSVCLCTTGPGGTNTVTGVLSAWQDSVPTIFISGNARPEHLTVPGSVRQIGTQEFYISELVRPITKKALLSSDISSAMQDLTELIDLSLSGRRGPVWFDIPLSFQYQNISPNESKISISAHANDSQYRNNIQLGSFLDSLTTSSRPFVIIGGGFPAYKKAAFISSLESLEVPYAFTYTSIGSSLCENAKFHSGVVGIAGTRHANYLAFHADHILCLGTHLPVPITGANHLIWCREAVKSLINIDINELENHRINFDHLLHYSCDELDDNIIKAFESRPSNKQWSDFTHQVLSIPEATSDPEDGFVDLYQFFDSLNRRIAPNFNLVVDGGGTVNSAAFSRLKPPLRCPLTMSSAICSMGSGLPELIGAYHGYVDANGVPPQKNILLVGDGSIAFNVQELLTVTSHDIPCIIFVFNNSGYLSIRTTLDTFLDSRHNGVCSQSGLNLYNISKLAALHDFDYHLVDDLTSLDNSLELLSCEENSQHIVEVMISPNQKIGPVQKFIIDDDGNGRPAPLAFMSPDLDLPRPTWPTSSGNDFYV